MFEKFTDRARKIIALAQKEAELLNHDNIGPEHLLLGILAAGDGVAVTALHNLDVDFQEVRNGIRRHAPKNIVQCPGGPLPFTLQAKRICEFAAEQARALGHPYIGTEHILLGIIGDPSNIPAQVLFSLDITLNDVQREILDLLGASDPNQPPLTHSFIIFVKSGDKILSSDEEKQHRGKVKAWIKSKAKEGHKVTGNIVGSGQLLLNSEGRIEPNPYSANGIISSFFHLEVADIKIAQSVAESYPMDHGITLEVRVWRQM
jgi:ATP-dependent Clp protease ATP-binding subunit ClpA